eukprot:s4938_g3.t1
MQYAMTADGARQRVRLSREQLRILEALNANCADESWHPCQITSPQKALLMTNNCRLVRRVRRKWYRRLTQKCNMHDRHSGVPTETPPVFVDQLGPVCADGATMEDVVERTTEATVVRAGTLNLKQLDLAHQIGEILGKLNLDVMCLQEMSAACLGDLLQVSEQRGYDVISPMHRQVTALEGFDVCILLKRSTVCKLRVSVMGLGPDSARRLLQVQLQVRGNGAILVLGTCHLTASRESAAVRMQELKAVVAIVASNGWSVAAWRFELARNGIDVAGVGADGVERRLGVCWLIARVVRDVVSGRMQSGSCGCARLAL